MASKAALRRRNTMLKPADMKVLVIGPYVWGRGDTLTEALVNADKPRYYVAYICHPDTWVDDGGCICYPHGFGPKEILRKAQPKKKLTK